LELIINYFAAPFAERQNKIKKLSEDGGIKLMKDTNFRQQTVCRVTAQREKSDVKN